MSYGTMRDPVRTLVRYGGAVALTVAVVFGLGYLYDRSLPPSILAIWSAVGSAVVLYFLKLTALQANLRERLELFTRAFQSNPAGLAISRVRDGRFVEINDAFSALTGHTRKDIIGQTAVGLGLVSAEEGGLCVADLAKKGSFSDREIVLTHPSGKERHVLVSCEMVAFHVQPHFITLLTDVTERSLADGATREQAELLVNAQRIGRMGSWRLDLRTGQLVWPAETCDLFGIAPGQFEGTIEHLRRLILPEDLAAFEGTVARMGSSREVCDIEYRIRRPDGAVRWVHSRGRGEFDATGASIGRLGMAMDITDQRLAQEQLVENAALLRIAGKVARLGGWTIQLPSRTLTWSDETCVIHDLPKGYRPTLDEGIAFFPPESRETVLRHMTACERDGTPYDLEVPKVTATGRNIWVRSIGEAVRDEHGRIVLLQGAFQDISARKLADEALLERARALRMQAHMLDNIGQAVIATDTTGRVTYANRFAGMLYGWPPAEMMGQAITDVTVPQVTPAQGADIMTRLLGGNNWNGEFLVQARDGRVFPADATSSPVRNDQGQMVGIVSISTDISARKQIEQQSLRAQRMESIGTLAGGIAHDLNNVLAPILMSIAVLQQDEQDADKLATLETIEASAKRGAAMISRVLSFARGVEGQRVDVQVTPLVRDLATIVRDTFPKNIELDERLDPDLWTLQADPTQLHQVLLNLCVNARDAMPAGGKITITAKNVVVDAATDGIGAEMGPAVMIEVEDTGTGMSKSIIDQIFDPFFTTKEMDKGTGLGLATSLAIVKGHRGSLRAYSTPGMGARFRLYLPAQVTTAPQDSVVAVPERPQGNGQMVLVVEDEALIRRITQRMLEGFGYRVMLAGGGAEAVALYTEHQSAIDVVMTDMMMPGMDGPATIRELMKLNPEVRIIAVSGLATENHAKTAGGTSLRFLAKPFSSETLLTALREALLQPA